MSPNFVLSIPFLFLLVSLCQTNEKTRVVWELENVFQKLPKDHRALFKETDFAFGAEPLGEGKCGRVELAEFLNFEDWKDRNWHLGEHYEHMPQQVAVKKITIKHVSENLEFIKREIESQMACDSPFIVQLYGFYIHGDYVNLVLEYMPNNQLGIVDRVIPSKNEGARSPEFGKGYNHFPKFGINEELARFYTAQLLLALHNLHSKGFSNNDLWIENILVDDKGFIKLSDFGWAFPFNEIREGNPNKRDEEPENHPFRGWFYYRAPERINVISAKDENVKNDVEINLAGKVYDKTSDLWSLGGVLFTMVTGHFPFSEPKAERKISNGYYNQSLIKHVSGDLKDLFRQLFEVDPKKRLGANGIKDFQTHKWFNGFQWDKLLAKNEKTFKDFLPTFRNFLNMQSNPIFMSAITLKMKGNKIRKEKKQARFLINNYPGIIDLEK